MGLIRKAGADGDGTGRSGRGQLHEAELVADGVIVVEVEARLVDIEADRTVDIGHRHHHELDLPVHRFLLNI